MSDGPTPDITLPSQSATSDKGLLGKYGKKAMPPQFTLPSQPSSSEISANTDPSATRAGDVAIPPGANDLPTLPSMNAVKGTK